MISGYSKFRDCVNEPLGHECGPKARNLMHHSLAFLMQKCDSQSDLSKYANQACPPLSMQRSLGPKHEISSAGSSHNAADLETENDYYLNEKHQNNVRENVVTTAQTQSQSNNILINRTLNSAIDEPLAQNLRKTLLTSTLNHSPTDSDYESELNSPSIDHEQHSTNTPQSVYYDPDSINSVYSIQNQLTIFCTIFICHFLLPFFLNLELYSIQIR